LLHGGSAAAPVARAVLEKYFTAKYAPEEIDTVVIPQSMLEGNSLLLVNDIAGGILRQQTQVVR